VANLDQPYCPRSGRRQIDISAGHERTAIVNPHDYESVMTHRHSRAKGQRTVRGSHGRAIYTLAIRGTTPAQPVVNAGNLGVSCTPVKTIVDIKEVGNSLGNKSIIVPRRYPRPTVLSYLIPINRLGSRLGDVLSAIP
jgi:hypothetical protein